MIRIIPKDMLVKAAWSSGGFAIGQVFRLMTNVVLAALLAPPLLGLMVIVNTVRTGVELLSDVGIGQNIVSHRDGASRDFVDTAWTVQVIRGVLLGAACFLLTGTLARYFEKPELLTILPVAALFFVFTGFNSASRALLQKQLSVRRLSLFDAGVMAFSFVVHVALALISPTIWALMLGSVFTGAATMVVSYQMVPGMRHRFVLTRDNVRELFRFGRWIFLSSIVYFASMNFDRLYFAKQVPLAALGVYGIARTLADTATNLSVRVCSMTLFPMVAAAQMEGSEIRQRMLHGRRVVLCIAAVGLALAMALGDGLVRLLYDARYQAAGIYLPIMLVGVWFALLCTVNESILTGLRRPAPQAFAHLTKFTSLLLFVPFAFGQGGFVAAIFVLSLSEGIRYSVLWAFGRRAHVAFGRDDLALTILLIFCWAGFSMIMGWIGIPQTITPAELWTSAQGWLG